MKRLLPAAGLLALLASSLAAQTADEIIERMERNVVFDTARSTGAMIIRDRFGDRASAFVSYSRGADTALIEFTSAEERGMKVLRTAGEIYLY
ncbi:MAG: hypothetical protein UY71_C0005G0026 [Parcubacteria group bacterium GW2011_GWB1_52_7]|nr:MAG: hypothetical protein UY71_C0005G0026 [Parcubacteria group bacterium GW2011_GWB1_52_7]